MKFITSYKSFNYDSRANDSDIRFIILHYTAMRSIEETINLLCSSQSKVSAHFLISKEGKIYQLVNEQNRAWHAGESSWKNITDINSNSLGIELENTGYLEDFEDYTEQQISSLMELITYLNSNYNISRMNILGHSDVAPMRKIDPGEKFPWHVLEKNNLVYLPKVQESNKNNNLELSNIIFFKEMLRKIGYNLENNNNIDKNLEYTTKAFQMHFQQNFVTGHLNHETLLIAEQYCKDIID